MTVRFPQVHARLLLRRSIASARSMVCMTPSRKDCATHRRMTAIQRAGSIGSPCERHGAACCGPSARRA